MTQSSEAGAEAMLERLLRADADDRTDENWAQDPQPGTPPQMRPQRLR